MYENVFNLGWAATLEHLRILIVEAISLAGAHADWIAHEDGEIRIYSEDEETIVVIEQPPLDIGTGDERRGS